MNILYRIHKQQLVLNYFLTYLLVAFSGISFFLGDIYMLAGFLFVALVFIIKKIKVDGFVLFFVSSLLVVFIVQSIYTNNIPYYQQIGFFIRILNAYFTIKIIGMDFPKLYVNIITILALTSFIFYFPILIWPEIGSFLTYKVAPVFAHYNFSTVYYKPSPNLIVFNLNPEYINGILFRNSGPFWEAGAFAGFLIVAILFELIISKKLFGKRNFILILALLTTFSTTGYIVLAVLSTSYFFLLKNRK